MDFNRPSVDAMLAQGRLPTVETELQCLMGHDAQAANEERGELAPAEAAMVAPTEAEIDAALATVLARAPISADEIFAVEPQAEGGPPDGERENAHLDLRLSLVHALGNPGSASYTALGRAAVKCARLGLRRATLLAISAQRAKGA